MSLRDKIRDVDDLKGEMYHVEEWDLDILLVPFSVKERIKISAIARQTGKVEEADKDELIFIERLLLGSCYDPETKEPVFQEGDMEWLVGKSAAVIDKIVSEILSVNGLSRDAAKEAEKN